MTAIRSGAAAAALMLAATPALSGDVASGEARFAENCTVCHGKTGKGLSSYPALRERSAEYIADKLTRYRAGEKIGPNSGLMISMARGLSDEEVANLAAYISTAFR